jgi:bifunctional non-homologous end joining protein LigD
VIWRDKSGSTRPMLATLAEPPLTGKELVFEPKYDGIRALVEIEPGRAARQRATVRLWSRLGNEKTSQFPSIVHALESFGAAVGEALVIDGEIVALDAKGRPLGFQRLQGRIHLSDAKDVERIDREQPVALIAFDLLREGDEDVRGLPLVERRARLERIIKKGAPAKASAIRISEQAIGDGRPLHARAQAEGWEGLIVKEARSPYQSGRRSPTWRKFKLQHEQEFVIGGWTEPRNTRQHFGALLLGVYGESGLGARGSGLEGQSKGKVPPKAGLYYVGHTGTGFNERELDRLSKLLKSRAIKESPFANAIKSNEIAHWVQPDLVAQVRFTEWTDDQKLRHPVYLGLRDDKKPEDVVKEDFVKDVRRQEAGDRTRQRLRPERGAKSPREASGGGAPRALRKADRDASTTQKAGTRSGRPPVTDVARVVRAMDGMQPVIDQIQALEANRKDGVVQLPDGSKIGISNPAKLFWPKLKLTKGDLLRYYASVAPLILPVVADRPLVMKRFPNGVDDRLAFYQQRKQKEQPPDGVRIETLPPDIDPIDEPDTERFIGGSLITLLYMTQLAAISQDPWFSRVESPLDADYTAIDLDPGEGATFAQVRDVARWVRDELAALKVPGFPKTSGSRGLHIFIPLPPGTSYESGQLFCQIVATVVASRHPKVATVERMVKKRPRATVYVDFLQNILGKTLACAYSARASDFAGVSTPLAWDEIDESLDPRDFTIRTAPARFREVGDLWAALRKSKPAKLDAVFGKYAAKL